MKCSATCLAGNSDFYALVIMEFFGGLQGVSGVYAVVVGYYLSPSLFCFLFNIILSEKEKKKFQICYAGYRPEF